MKTWKVLFILCTLPIIIIDSCSKGSSTGSEESAVLPTVSTSAITNITSTTATSGGNISSSGGDSISARGVCWNTLTNPTTANSHTTDGTGSGSFISSLTGLSTGTGYYVRAYAANSVGTAYGNQVSLMRVLPTVSTSAVTNISSTTATSGGNVTDSGSDSVTGRGVCWNTSPNPTTANNHTSDAMGSGSFVSSLTGLSSGTGYYVRAYAANSIGTSYGSQVTFTTNTLTDIDGNLYHTVTIGTQSWMLENLRTTKYRNGDPIPLVTDSTWGSLGTGAYCDYNNDTSNASIYGHLYNWQSVRDGRNIAPTGWHVAGETDWATLVSYLGDSAVAGGKLKETGTAHWLISVGATNETGFTARPGGIRGSSGFFYLGSSGFWWSVDFGGSSTAREIDANGATIYRAALSIFAGASVRCVKD